MGTIINIKVAKKCAFCKHWYDPTNSAISPKAPNIGLWQIKDDNQRSLCMKKNIETPAFAGCPQYYECKL